MRGPLSLYAPLVEFLTKDALKENEASITFDTSNQRRKGTWQNPDVTKVLVETYPTIRKRKIHLTSYEVKQWQRWDESSVFETASHSRAVHEAILVLEWSGTTTIDEKPGRIPAIVRECERFGVGLATMEPFRKGFRMKPYLEPELRSPRDEDVEFFLSSAFEYDPEAAAKFDALLDESDQQLASSASARRAGEASRSRRTLAHHARRTSHGRRQGPQARNLRVAKNDFDARQSTAEQHR